MAALVAGVSYMSKAQGFEPGAGFKQLNFGLGAYGWGIPIYAEADFGISDKITIGPRVGYQFGFANNYTYYKRKRSSFDIAFRGDYHYGSHISGLPNQLDLYGGLMVGISFRSYNYTYDPVYQTRLEGSETVPTISFRGGGRWYFNNNWGANAEIGLGTYSGLEIGLSYRF